MINTQERTYRRPNVGKLKRPGPGDWVILAVCVLLILACLLPVMSVAARSLSSNDALIRRDVTLWPVELTFDAYRTVLSDARFTWSLAWTAMLTGLFTILAMLMTVFCAYPLHYDHLKGRRLINILIIFTMYFHAGIVPMFLLYQRLGLLNHPMVLVLPGLISVFNMIIMRSFFYGIPESLRESAEIDGAGPVRVLLKVYLPLSKPVLATLSLFYAVGRWNGFSDALMFVQDRTWHPIQLLLFNILQNIVQIEVQAQEGFAMPGHAETLRSASVMVAMIPILLVYPWLQKYFISGVTLGAVKG